MIDDSFHHGSIYFWQLNLIFYTIVWKKNASDFKYTTRAP